MPKAQTKATAPTPAPDTPLPVEYAVRIYPVKDSKYTLANANVDINGVFAIRGVKAVSYTHLSRQHRLPGSHRGYHPPELRRNASGQGLYHTRAGRIRL